MTKEWQSAAVTAKLRFGNEAPSVGPQEPSSEAEAKSRTGSRREKRKDGARRVA